MNNDNKTTKSSAASNFMQLMSFTADKALELADAGSILGEKIEVDGITIIPVSKISAGFAGGGANIVNAAVKKSNTPSGSGAKVTVTPLSFLVISEGEVRVIDINPAEKSKESLIETVVNIAKSVKKSKKSKDNEAV